MKKALKIVRREIEGILPEAFQGVVLALLAGKQVNDEVDGVEDQPATRLEAVARIELDLVVLERFFKVVPEGLEVRVGGARGDHETIGEGGRVAKVEKLEVLGLLVKEGLAGKAQVGSQFRFGGWWIDLHGEEEGEGEGFPRGSRRRGREGRPGRLVRPVFFHGWRRRRDR